MAPQKSPSNSLLHTTAGRGAKPSPAVMPDDENWDVVAEAMRYRREHPPKTNYRALEWLEMYPELREDFNDILLNKEIERDLLAKKIKSKLFLASKLDKNLRLIMSEYVRHTDGKRLEALNKDIRWFRLGLYKPSVTKNGLTDDEIQQARDFPVEELINTNKVNKMWCCPFHEEKTPSFHIYKDNGWHCFGCQAHGNNAVDYVMKKNKMEFVEAVRFLIGKK